MSDSLFPVRRTRRDFVKLGLLAVGGLALNSAVAADDAKPVTIGTGANTFTLDPAWGVLPKGMKYGLGCAIVADRNDNIIVTSRSQSPCVAVFGADGKLVETWSEDFAEKVGYRTSDVAGTAHGLYYSVEGKDEFLYFTENAPGKRVYKTDMKGKILYELGLVKKEGPAAQAFKFDNPTDVAVAANGDVYVVDGYGSQLVHRFDKNFKLIKTMGGPGKEHGKFNTCHGIWVSTIGKEPEIWIADRANGRIEIFDLALTYKRTIEGLKAPCCFYQHAGMIYVPELSSRVSVVDGSDKLVHLGDGTGVKDKGPEHFIAPHALTLDSKGNLYVVEWVGDGRVRKFKRNAV